MEAARQKESREGSILEDEVGMVLWGRAVSHRAFSTIYDHWLLLRVRWGSNGAF